MEAPQTTSESERTAKREREIAPHPSLKPQSLLRQLVLAVLPLGTSVIADSFILKTAVGDRVSP